MGRKKSMAAYLLLLAGLAIQTSATIASHEAAAPNLLVLEQWQAGAQVTTAQVNSYGIDRCFVAETISQPLFKRIWKKSYKEACTLPVSDLRYVKVLHCTLDGKSQLGEMVCNKAIAPDLVAIFRALYEAHYPIERMVLVDDYNADDNASMEANNTSCFNFRTVSGTKKRSKHSKGMAIDINTRYNPYVKRRANGTLLVRPASGKQYADRSKRFAYKIDHSDLCYKLFKQHGFVWGGDWRSVKDYQHFEKAY